MRNVNAKPDLHGPWALTEITYD